VSWASSVPDEEVHSVCGLLAQPNRPLHVDEKPGMFPCTWLTLAHRPRTTEHCPLGCNHDTMRLDHREQQYLHQHSIRHRPAIERSEICGCFYCQSVFPPNEITEWIDGADDSEDAGVTALCPRCGIDSVLPSGTGITITPGLLAEMHRYWFSSQPNNGLWTPPTRGAER
jgi:hypothetical protein